MKKILLLNSMLAVLFLSATAQSVNTDQELKPAIAGDTALVNHYLRSAQEFESSNTDSAKFYYTKAKILATSIMDKDGLGKAYVKLFLIFLYKENNYNECMALSQEETDIGAKWNDNVLQMKGYNNSAIAYQYLNDYQTATTYYLKAAGFANKAGDQIREAKILDNMASLFLNLKNYSTAYAYGLRSYKLSEALQDSLYMNSGLNTIGAAEAGMGKYKAALLHLNQAETIGRRIHNPIKVAAVMENKGMVYLGMKEPQAATEEFQKALDIADESNFAYIKFTSLKGLSDAEILRENYSKAEQYATKAVALGERIGLGTELSDMYSNSSMIKQKLGKLSESLTYKDKYEKLNDSLMGIQLRTNINRLNIQYQTAQKDKQILQQKLQLAESQTAIQRKNTWLSLFLLGITALILVLILSIRNHHNKKKLHQQMILSLHKEQEVVRLKAMMEGQDQERQRISREMHDDIGSGLTTILFLSGRLKNNPVSENRLTGEKITKNVNSLISKMNEIIWSMNTDYDTLEDLVAYIRHNAGELLENAGVNYHFTIPDNMPDMKISGEQRRNIYLTVKEALHNIIKHANASLVNIDLHFGKEINLHIKDNGKGIDHEKLRLFGNGMKNMRRRMEAVGGGFEISDNNDESGTVIHLTVPVPG